MQEFINFSLKHWELWLAFFVILSLWMGLELRNKFVGFPQLSPQQTTRLINHENALILDIRDSATFSKGHIIGSLNIPLEDLPQKLSQLQSYKNQPVVIVYKTGQAFSKAGLFLQKQGFSKINSLKDGIMSWQNAGLPLIKKR